jgi:signal transduction histidine kinase
MDVTHRQKVDHLIAELGHEGAGPYTVAPPLFRPLWALGMEVPPPFFLEFFPLTVLMDCLAKTREEEQRLRRDLHDGLGPTLAGLSFGLDAVRNLLRINELEGADALLAQLKSQMQTSIADIRCLVHNLRPPALDELGLVAAIHELALNHSLTVRVQEEAGCDGDGLDFSVEAPEHLPPLPAAMEVACYRIVQEAITNVMRHSRAHSCRIRLSIYREPKQLELEIVDDGVGLPTNFRAGMGLVSMCERAAELGGTCVVGPVPTGGTRILAQLPLSLSEEQENDHELHPHSPSRRSRPVSSWSARAA